MPAHSRASGLVAAIALATLAHACTPDELPMAPTPFNSGVILYEHANFLGNSAHLTADLPDLRDFRGPCLHGDDASSRDWNDCVSSVRIAPGARATLYRDSNFKGESLELTGDIPNLQLVRGTCSHDGLNDCVTSIRFGNP